MWKVRMCRSLPIQPLIPTVIGIKMMMAQTRQTPGSSLMENGISLIRTATWKLDGLK